MSAVIGIDPGATGWIVAVDSDGIVWSHKLPQTPRELALCMCQRNAGGDAPVFVEIQHPMPKQGLGSTFATGRGYGVILGVLAMQGCPTHLIRSQDWQKAMLRGESKAKGKALKETYTRVAERMWPSVQFRGPRGGIWDGKAAAALIAEHGRRVLMGQ